MGIVSAENINRHKKYNFSVLNHHNKMIKQGNNWRAYMAGSGLMTGTMSACSPTIRLTEKWARAVQRHFEGK